MKRIKKTAILFWIFLQAGTFTFAGGLAMLPLIQKGVVDKYKLMDEETFSEQVALSQTLPGMIALNCAIFVGKTCGGVLGAIVTGVAVVLPAFLAMLAAVSLLNILPKDNPRVIGAFRGIRAASAALILAVGIKLSKKSIKSLFTLGIALIAIALIIFVKISVFPVVIAAGVAGIVYFIFYEKKQIKENIK